MSSMAKRSKQLSEHLLVFFNDIRSAEQQNYCMITERDGCDAAASPRLELCNPRDIDTSVLLWVELFSSSFSFCEQHQLGEE